MKWDGSLEYLKTNDAYFCQGPKFFPGIGQFISHDKNGAP